MIEPLAVEEYEELAEFKAARASDAALRGILREKSRRIRELESSQSGEFWLGFVVATGCIIFAKLVGFV